MVYEAMFEMSNFELLAWLVVLTFNITGWLELREEDSLPSCVFGTRLKKPFFPPVLCFYTSFLVVNGGLMFIILILPSPSYFNYNYLKFFYTA